MAFRKNSKRYLVLLTAVLVLSMSAAPVSAAPEFEPMTIQIGHVNASTPEDPIQYMCTTLAEYVSNATGGAVKIETFGDAVLGTEPDQLEGLKFGTMQMTVTSNGTLSTMNPTALLVDLPFVFPNYDIGWKFLDDPVLDVVRAQVLENSNAVLLEYAGCGIRQMLNNTHPFQTVADFKGVKMRSMENKVFVDMFTLLGTNPTPIAYSEVFTALQQGTVDGMDCPIAGVYSSQFNKVAKYIDLTNHIFCGNAYLINKDLWESFSPELQKIFKDGAKECAVKSREFLEAGEAQMLKEFEEKDGNIINYNVDTTTMREAVAPMMQEYRDIIGAEYFDAATQVIDKLKAEAGL